jgi:hypothetical protein
MNHLQLTPMFNMIELHIQQYSELFIRNYSNINDYNKLEYTKRPQYYSEEG